MTVGGSFCNALGLKDSIESLPIAQPRFFLVDEHCPAGERKKIFDVDGSGIVDMIAEIQTSKWDDQLMFEPQFDGQSELWCPQYVRSLLWLWPGVRSVVSCYLWDDVFPQFGILFNAKRRFSHSFQVWLDNRDETSEHLVRFMLLIYSKF